MAPSNPPFPLTLAPKIPVFCDNSSSKKAIAWLRVNSSPKWTIPTFKVNSCKPRDNWPKPRRTCKNCKPVIVPRKFNRPRPTCNRPRLICKNYKPVIVPRKSNRPGPTCNRPRRTCKNCKPVIVPRKFNRPRPA